MTMSNMKLENWRIVTLDSNFFIELYIYIYIYLYIYLYIYGNELPMDTCFETKKKGTFRLIKPETCYWTGMVSFKCGNKGVFYLFGGLFPYGLSDSFADLPYGLCFLFHHLFSFFTFV